MSKIQLKKYFDMLYDDYNNKASSNDPVWILHGLNEADAEIFGFILSCYTYGNITQINRFAGNILKVTGKNVYEFTANFSKHKAKKYFDGFNYRFNTDYDLIYLFENIKNVINTYGNLKNLFLSGLKSDDVNIINALHNFVSLINSNTAHSRTYSYLIPSPENNSTCKRLNLFLRWMVRKDNIDLGIWSEAGKEKLIMPVDVHIYRVSRELNLVNRKSCDLKYALELTEALKSFDSADPVKYDFALCHKDIENIIKNPVR